jgi:hypothetical protein
MGPTGDSFLVGRVANPTLVPCHAELVSASVVEPHQVSQTR